MGNNACRDLRFQNSALHRPARGKPARQGFGTCVVTTMLAEDFGGKVDVAYEPAGFTHVLTAPLANLPNAPASLKEIAGARR